MFAPGIPGNRKAPKPGLLQLICDLSSAVTGVCLPLSQRAALGALPAALMAWSTRAVELVSDGCPAAAMYGKPASLDCTASSALSMPASFEWTPHAVRPCTAHPVLFVSGPVKEFGSAGPHGTDVSARYDCQSPFAHCC